MLKSTNNVKKGQIFTKALKIQKSTKNLKSKS